MCCRHSLLGNSSYWFPGANANTLGESVSEASLLAVLSASPWRERIPLLLRQLKEALGEATSQRLGGE